MKKIMLLAAGVALSIALAACSSVPQQTPAQIAATVCPGVQSELALLSASGVFTGGAAATLANQIQPDVAAVCASGATVTSVNLQTLVNAALPVVVAAVNVSSLTDQQKLEATLAVGALATAVNTALQLQPAPVSTVPQTTPASQPAAA
jgi:hypothetical protein